MPHATLQAIPWLAVLAAALGVLAGAISMALSWPQKRPTETRVKELAAAFTDLLALLHERSAARREDGGESHEDVQIKSLASRSRAVEREIRDAHRSAVRERATALTLNLLALVLVALSAVLGLYSS